MTTSRTDEAPRTSHPPLRPSAIQQLEALNAYRQALPHLARVYRPQHRAQLVPRHGGLAWYREAPRVVDQLVARDAVFLAYAHFAHLCCFVPLPLFPVSGSVLFRV